MRKNEINEDLEIEKNEDLLHFDEFYPKKLKILKAKKRK